MVRKGCFVLLLIFVLSLSFASAQDYAGVDPSGQTVVYWHQYSEESAQETAMNALIEEFNGSNMYGITVEGAFQGSYGPIEDLMETAILSGELPNLVAGYANAAAGWANEGVVVDLNVLLNDGEWGIAEEDQANLNFSLLDVNQLDFEPFNGMRVAWANQNSINLMYVNLDMIERLGFERRAPNSWDEFEAISCASAEAEGTNGHALNLGASGVESVVAAFGGNIFDSMAGAYDFTTPEVVAAFELYKRLFDSGCGYVQTERFQDQADFALGLTPFTIGSSAGVPFYQGAINDSGLEDEWIVSSLPGVAEDAPRSIQLFVPSQALITSTPEAELATWLFVKFLAETEPQLLWSSSTGYLSTRTDVEVTADDLNEDRMPFAYYEALVDLITDDSLVVYASPGVPSYSAVRGLIDDAIAEVTSGGADVAEVVEALTAEANELREELDFGM